MKSIIELLKEARLYFDDDREISIKIDEVLNKKNGIYLICHERSEQIEKHGYTINSDISRYDKDSEDIVLAAISYLTPSDHREYGLAEPTRAGHYKKFRKTPKTWPWDDKYWKPSPDDRIKELTKSGALIAAEIDRLQNLTYPPLYQVGLER
jgi:hypothetical protein